MKVLTILALFSAVLVINAQIPNGTWKLRSFSYGIFWDICGASCGANPDNLFTKPNNFEADSQLFIIQSLPSGYYTIKSKLNDLYLTSSTGSPSNSLFFAPQSNSIDQEFSIRFMGYPDGELQIEGSHVIKPRQFPEQAIEAAAGQLGEPYLNTKNCQVDIQRFVIMTQQETGVWQ